MTAIALKASSLSRLLGHWRGAEDLDPHYRQLARALQLLILDGRLGLGVRLPGERELAKAIGVSRTTLTAAYGQLRDEGYLVSRQGSGSVTRLPAGRPAAPELGGDNGEDGFIDWTAAALPASPVVRRAYEEGMKRLPAWLGGTGYEVLGIAELREAIASDYARRGCATRPEQIMVTSGAQSGLTLVLRALTGPGDRIAVDQPTYHNALGAIARSSCQAIPVSLPETGWDLDAVEAVFRQAAPRLAYLVPDFHVPTGRLMDEESRRRLVQIAERTRTPLLIDETMAETGFGFSMPAPVAAFDPDDAMVMSVGSVSKRYWGGLRVGWIRANEQRIAELARLRATIDMATPILEQLAVAAMLRDHGAGTDQRGILRDRCEMLIALLAEALPHWRVSRPDGGLALWAELPRPEASALAAVAHILGLRIAPGPRFATEGAFERFVRLPFTLSEPDLRRAVERLALADAQLNRRGGRAGKGGAAFGIEAERII